MTEQRIYKISFHRNEDTDTSKYQRYIDTTTEAILNHDGLDVDIIIEFHMEYESFMHNFILHWTKMGYPCTPVIRWSSKKAGNPDLVTVTIEVRKDKKLTPITRDENGLLVPLLSVKLEQPPVNDTNTKGYIIVSSKSDFSLLNEQARFKDYIKVTEQKLETLRRVEGNLSLTFEEKDKDLIEAFKVYWRKKEFIIESDYNNPLKVILFVFHHGGRIHAYFKEASTDKTITDVATQSLANQYRSKILDSYIKQVREVIEKDLYKRKGTIILPSESDELFPHFLEYWCSQDFKCRVNLSNRSLIIEW